MSEKNIDPHLKEVFDQLSKQVTSLTWKWQTAMRLFGEGKERIDLLNKTAQSFFFVVQITLRDDVFLTLSRFTDPLKSAGQDNLVIGRLLKHLDEKEHPTFYRQLEEAIELVHKSCKPFRLYRNKIIAHTDMSVKLKYTSEPLPGISVNEVFTAIDSLQNVMNLFSKYFFDSTTYYEEVFESSGVKSLVLYLQKGLDAFESEENEHLSAHGLTRRSHQSA
jgi:hypothetical protein